MIITDEKILRIKSEPVNDDENVKDIVKEIKETINTSWVAGCGLAAVQIGIHKRVAWFIIDGIEEILVNPIILKAGGFITYAEKCLSIPNKQTKIKRFSSILYKSNNKVKRASGFKACIIQHEIDHMNGILNIDKEIKGE